MIETKFPPGFDFKKKTVEIEEDLCNEIPDFEEWQQVIDFIVSIREQWCPVTNYDISGRASRGLFVAIPDSGMEALSCLQNNGICEVMMSTFSYVRRYRISRNCYLWGCSEHVKLTSLSFVDALNRWYASNSVMTPVYLDVSRSIDSLNLVVNSGHSIQLMGLDLRAIILKCFEVRVPFLCLRVNYDDCDVIRDYHLDLRFFQVNLDISSSEAYIVLVPPIQQLEQASLVYPGKEQLPTIYSQQQFKTIWDLGGEAKERTEQWIQKECYRVNKAADPISLIEEMVGCWGGV